MPSSSAFISPWLLWRTLSPFHPVYELTNPNLFAIVFTFPSNAYPSVLVKTSLPTITIGNLAFLIYSHNSWVPLARSLIILAELPKCSYSYVRSFGVPIE